MDLLFMAIDPRFCRDKQNQTALVIRLLRIEFILLSESSVLSVMGLEFRNNYENSSGLDSFHGVKFL